MAKPLRVYSWTHTLTEWCVIQAFRRAGAPGCLRRPPALAAAFVSEVSDVVRSKTLSLRKAEIIGLLQAAAESAYEQVGGIAYRAARETAATAEDDFLRAAIRTGGSERHLVRRQRSDDELAALRARFTNEARAAQRHRARGYWSDQRQQWLRPDLFENLRDDHPLLRLAGFAPVWWALFVRNLRQEFFRCNLSSFHLLNELPGLRQAAQRTRKKVLVAVVEEWRDAHADELGLPSQLHYHVLERRGRQRARAAARWFNARAPGFTTRIGVAESARELLACHLESLPTSPASSLADN